MSHVAIRYLRRLGMSTAVLFGSLLAPILPAAAQATRPPALSAPEVRASDVLARGGYAVVIDLEANELHFVHGRNVLWTAPVGTGMGLRLRDGNRGWTFTTPTGEYEVQAKEENPTWYAPDWYFIENKLPVPPRDDRRRRFPGGLGAAAIYIGSGLAIHGTDKPDLLGQRVSHGCIRLANEYAQRLYHNVQVGTKVIIVGDPEDEVGDLVPGQVPGTGPVDARTERLRQQAKAQRERLSRSLERASHDALEERLRDALRDGESAEVPWPAIAGELIRRGAKENDVLAARILLEAATRPASRQTRTEYATFLADLAARRGVLTARALSAVPERERIRAAGAIAAAAVDLFGGDPGDPVLPWPTRRILAEMIDDDARPGWEALADAERSVRERRAPARGAR